jgi:hypothetical protein
MGVNKSGPASRAGTESWRVVVVGNSVVASKAWSQLLAAICGTTYAVLPVVFMGIETSSRHK